MSLLYIIPLQNAQKRTVKVFTDDRYRRDIELLYLGEGEP